MTYVIIGEMLPTIYYVCNCNGSTSTSWTPSGSRNLSHVVHAVKAVPGSVTENSMEGVHALILVLVYHTSAVQLWTSCLTFLMASY